MIYGWLDGVENAEHNGVWFVEISKIFAMQDTFFIRKISFYNVRSNLSTAATLGSEKKCYIEDE